MLKKLIVTIALVIGVSACSVTPTPSDCPSWVRTIQPACSDAAMSDYLFLQIDDHNVAVTTACKGRTMPKCADIGGQQ